MHSCSLKEPAAAQQVLLQKAHARAGPEAILKLVLNLMRILMEKEN